MNSTALLVVDMVKDFTDPQGAVFYPQNREILPRIAALVEHCRDAGKLIVYLQHCNRAGKTDEKAAAMRPNCVEGTGGEELDPMLTLDTRRDYVIKKRRYSGFFGTDLDLVLRENHIKNTVIVGNKTNCCIRATVTDAFYLNYNPIVIRECVATNSETVNKVHLDDIQRYLGTVTTLTEFYEKMNCGVW